MFRYLLLTLLLFTSFANAQFTPQANYYRFWQGFKNTNLSSQDFVRRLPTLMQDTVNLYTGNGINTYIVAVPPEQRPSFIPDEFALIAFDSEASYRAIRATPAGKAYADDHWNYFDKETSLSAPVEKFSSSLQELQTNVAYNVIGNPTNWRGAYVSFYIGARKPGVSLQTFKTRMARHLNIVGQTLAPQGMIGYLALITENYEVAYMAWESQDSMVKAFSSPEGKNIAADGAEIMENLMWRTSESFYNDAQENKLYKVIQD